MKLFGYEKGHLRLYGKYFWQIFSWYADAPTYDGALLRICHRQKFLRTAMVAESEYKRKACLMARNGDTENEVTYKLLLLYHQKIVC